MPTTGAPDLVPVEVEVDGVAVRALQPTAVDVEHVLRQHVLLRASSGMPGADGDAPDLALLAERLAPLLSEAGVTLVGARTLLLRAAGSRRVLRFHIGTAEADAVSVQRQRVAVPRPMSHDLMKSLLDATQARVERVVITRPEDGTYRATVTVRRGRGRPADVDARPSDAVNLALRAEAPIFVDARLLEEPPASEPDRPRREAPAA